MCWLAVAVLVGGGVPAVAAADTFVVTTPDDVSGECPGERCSLRSALLAAGDGDTIRLPDHGRPYTQAQATFVVSRSVRLVGDGADRTIVRGTAGRTFLVSEGQEGERPTVVMSHLQIADGRISFGAGGNILNSGGVLTLDHVRVTGGLAYQGGGVANTSGGKLVIRRSLIDQNLATYSEGGANGGGIFSDSFGEDRLVVEDSTIAGNEAQAGGGIAVYDDVERPSLRSARLERVTIAHNGSNEPGPGGLLVGPRTGVAVHGSLLARNIARELTFARTAVADRPSNCEPKAQPVDGGGNLADIADCGFMTADPKIGEELIEDGETLILPIPPDSPAVDIAGACQGADQRDLVRPQGAACDAGAYEVAVPTIDAGPDGTTSDPTVTFTFSSAGGFDEFECRLDGPSGEGPWEGCSSPKSYSSLPAGSYTFYVRAAGAATHAGRSFSIAAPPPVPQPAPPPLPPPATPAQTPQPTPTPQPVYRKSVSVKPTKGTVRVKLPGTNRYVDLESLDTVPLGTSIDVRKGRVRLYAARDSRGTVQAATFYSGVFRVVQRGSVTELQLRGPKPRCASRKSASKSTATVSKKNKKARKRRLWGSGRGRFRTRGRFSAATVRGTKWLVEDGCRSTTTRVTRGVVTVRDFKRKRTITLRAGDRYVARRR